MDILLSNIGKKFRTEWVFRDIDFLFEGGKRYAITGHNGSGKSTLLNVMAGIIPANKGKLTYSNSKGDLGLDAIFRHISFTAPYMELIEEYTLSELVDFHIKFKPFEEGLGAKDFFEKVYLTEHLNKPIKQFSSGMKQRLKLGLAFYSASDVIFLDEPTTNLDEKGIEWYLHQVSRLENSKLVLVSSNDKREYQFCDEVFDITNYKKVR